MVTAILGLAGFLIRETMCNDLSTSASDPNSCVNNNWQFLGSSSISTTAVLISIFNVTLPLIFFYIAKLERYSTPVWEARVTLARSFLLKIASIYLILVNYYLTNVSGQLAADTCWEDTIGEGDEFERHGHPRT
jgi:hypothetical protein